MTGLDKILSCISDEANRDADMILEAGKLVKFCPARKKRRKSVQG